MVIRFDDVVINAEAHEVRRSGDLIEVQPQVLSVLLYLIEHRDRVVSKVEILDAVWQHRFVTESALTSRIKSARQAIGDNGRDQRVIRTVHGRGYRFVPVALDVVAGAAAIGVPESAAVRASLLHVVAQHPATDDRTRQSVRRILEGHRSRPRAQDETVDDRSTWSDAAVIVARHLAR